MTPPEVCDLSFVVPAYDEEGRIGPTVDAVRTWARAYRGRCELVIVDDGSRDDTAETVERMAAQPRGSVTIRVLREPHRGKGSAVARGMLAATGRHRLFMDADLAVPLQYVEEVERHLVAGADVVIGSRELPGATRRAEPSHRHILGRMFNRAVVVMVLPGIADTQCGFKAFTGKAADFVFGNVRLYPAHGNSATVSRVTAFDVEALVIARVAGMRIVELPVDWSHVEASKVRPLADALRMGGDLMRVWWSLRRGMYGNLSAKWAAAQ